MGEFPDEPESLPAVPQPGLIGILQAAVQGRASIDTIERIAALYERAETRNAAAAFNASMAAFQNACPSIPKTSKAEIVSETTGSRYTIRYAELDQIAATIRPHLSANGLSYTWDSDVKDGSIKVVCTIRHEMGHSVTASFSCPTKPKTGSMSGQQEVAAALTYARRQSLIQALGLTTCDPDSDNAPREPIGPDMVAKIEKALADTGSDVPKYLAFAGVASLAEIATRDLASVLEPLNLKLRAAGKPEVKP